MRRTTLDQTYLFRGKFYGPGETEVPEDFPLPEEAADDTKAAPVGEVQQPAPVSGRPKTVRKGGTKT